MAISGLDHIVLNVADIERSLRFYSDVLGLSPERVEAWRKREISFPSVRINSSTLIDLVANGAPSPSAHENLAHFCLVIDDPSLDGFMQTLASASVPIETGPVQRWGARGNAQSIYFRDPDANLIEVRTYN
jgi:catechol 2,3-dioxygenase-like lactoylglutathione lyase family enzyme